MPLSGIGIGEMLVIAMLVLIVFGPRRLPEITRSMGKAVREFKRGMNEIQRELELADRESRWSPPPPASGSAANSIAAGVAGTQVTSPSAQAETERTSSEGAGTASEGGAGVAASGTDDSGDADGAAEDGAATAAGDPLTPPTPTPGYVDPAEEFIDPWSTDSSSFGSTRPRSSPGATEASEPPDEDDGKTSATRAEGGSGNDDTESVAETPREGSTGAQPDPKD